MLLTFFHSNGCIKSRFLRLVLREMDWEVRELDVKDPAAVNELLQFKEKFGSGSKAIFPAIYTSEAYSHELFCILEYLNERNPGMSMYPQNPAVRLYMRSEVTRLLRRLVPAWEAFKATGDISGYDQLHTEFAESIHIVAKTHASIRSAPEVPSYLEILIALFLVEHSRTTPISDTVVAQWHQQMLARHSFAKLLTEFSKDLE